MQTYTMNSKLLDSLTWMIDAADGSHYKWLNIPKEAPRWMINDRTYNRLRYWGLAEHRMIKTEAMNRKAGMWRPTMLGIEWRRGIKEIPKTVYVLNGEVQGFGKKTILAREVT